MSTNYYRLIVIGSAITWFLLGMHAPIVHQITHHDRSPSVGLMVAVSCVALLALAGLVTLLRARPSRG